MHRSVQLLLFMVLLCLKSCMTFVYVSQRALKSVKVIHKDIPSIPSSVKAHISTRSVSLSSSLSPFDWSLIDTGYLITCPNGDPESLRLKRSLEIIKSVRLEDKMTTLEFETDDEDRIRGCYNSHIETLKRAKRDLSSSNKYSVLVMEDNVSVSPNLSASTLSSLAAFSSRNQWDMLHLAYIMYVPSLVVTKTASPGVVRLSTGSQSALGTTCYVISEAGVDALLARHEEKGYTLPIPDLMAELFPESRYAASPMLFHRASKVKSLVNPQLDTLRELLFEPAFYTKWEAVMVATGLGTNVLFPLLVASLLLLSLRSGSVSVDAASQLLETGQFQGNALLVGASAVFSALSLMVLAQGVMLAPSPPAEKEE